MTEPLDDALIGRDDDLRGLGHAVDRHRLVTLHGAGGVGKTTLARALGHGRHGAVFVSLVGARTLDDLVSPWAAALGLRIGELGPTTDAAVTRLIDALAGRGDVLLVLDNVEQVKGALSPLLARLVAGAPRARVLATSREPLDVPDEHTFELLPLSVEAASRLFVARAQRVNPHWEPSDAEPLGRVLDMLGHNPLAIELAAARTEVLSLAQLVERLHKPLTLLRSADSTLEARHRVLADTIQWSWDLLEPDEQVALAWLAQFENGFTAAEAAALLPPSVEAERLLRGLVRKSLVVGTTAAHPRHRLLPVVRSFVRERRALPAPEHAADRFATMFLRWVGELDPRRADDVDWALAHVDDVVVSLRHQASLRPAEVTVRLSQFDPLFGPMLTTERFMGLFDAVLAATDDPALIATLRVARGEAWLIRQRHAEAGEDAAAAWAVLDGCSGSEAETLRARALSLSGSYLKSMGRFAEAREAFAKVEPVVAHSPGDRARLMGRLFAADILEGRLDAADARAEDVLVAAREAGSLRDEVFVLINRGWMRFERGEAAQARADFLAAEPLAAHFASDDIQILVAFNLGWIELEHDELSAAFDRATAVLERAERNGSRLLMGMGALLLGLVLAEQGDDDGAEGWLAQADQVMTGADDVRRARFCPQGYRAVCLLRLGRWEAAQALVQELAADTAPSVKFAPARAFLYPAAQMLLDRRGEAAPLADVPGPVAEALTLPAQGPTRLALRWLRRALRHVGPDPEAEPGPQLRVGPDQDRFTIGGEEVDLRRRGPARRVFQALLAQHRERPDQALPWSALFAAAWPGQTAGPQTARNRVYTAVRELRRFGLGTWLVNREDGYLLSPSLDLVQD